MILSRPSTEVRKNHELIDISDRAGGSGTIRERQPGEAAAALVSLRGVCRKPMGSK